MGGDRDEGLLSMAGWEGVSGVVLLGSTYGGLGLRGRVREEEEGRCWEEEEGPGVLELSATDEACCWSSTEEKRSDIQIKF